MPYISQQISYDIVCDEQCVNILRQLVSISDLILRNIDSNKIIDVSISSSHIETRIPDACLIPLIINSLKGEISPDFIENILTETNKTIPICVYLADVDDVATFLIILNDLLKDAYTHMQYTAEGHFKYVHVVLLSSLLSPLKTILEIIGVTDE